MSKITKLEVKKLDEIDGRLSYIYQRVQNIIALPGDDDGRSKLTALGEYVLETYKMHSVILNHFYEERGKRNEQRKTA